MPFAAGNFLYIAAADLLPELTRHPEAARKILLTLCFLGLGILLLVALLV